MLAEVALALGHSTVSPAAYIVVADVAQQRLDPAGAEDRVVDVVLVGRRQAAVAAVAGLLVGVVEDDELQLGAGEGDAARARRRRVDLGPQDLPRATGATGRAVEPGEVALDHRRCRAAAAASRSVSRSSDELHVAVALLPRARSRSRRRCSCRRRRRAGSCSPRCRARAPSSRKYWACSRLPCSRPCMSVKATTTVSICPESTLSVSAWRDRGSWVLASRCVLSLAVPVAPGLIQNPSPHDQ